jgi:hypothetical protein
MATDGGLRSRSIDMDAHRGGSLRQAAGRQADGDGQVDIQLRSRRPPYLLGYGAARSQRVTPDGR